MVYLCFGKTSCGEMTKLLHTKWKCFHLAELNVRTSKALVCYIKNFVLIAKVGGLIRHSKEEKETG